MLPDAILSDFGDKKNLGVHTEMFSDGVMELVKAGVINGSKKTIHPRKIVTSFVIGSAELMEFVDNNPSIEFHPSDYTNDITVIAKNNKMVAINTASVIDLTGQVLADRTGLESISNPGGMPDFIRGALSARGRTIIVMPSTTSDGQTSRIVSVVPKGAEVGAMRRTSIMW